jgi:hypothetical protein
MTYKALEEVRDILLDTKQDFIAIRVCRALERIDKELEERNKKELETLDVLFQYAVNERGNPI